MLGAPNPVPPPMMGAATKKPGPGQGPGPGQNKFKRKVLGSDTEDEGPPSRPNPAQAAGAGALREDLHEARALRALLKSGLLAGEAVEIRGPSGAAALTGVLMASGSVLYNHREVSLEAFEQIGGVFGARRGERVFIQQFNLSLLEYAAMDTRKGAFLAPALRFHSLVFYLSI